MPGLPAAYEAMALSAIDLFAGCGGLSLGFRDAGIEAMFAVEAHPDAFETYRSNLLVDGTGGWPSWLPVAPLDAWDLLELYGEELRALRGSIDVVAGGPPCQGFTTNGRRDADDPRNRLVDAHLGIVEAVRPRLVVVENVRGFASMPHADGGTFPDHVRRRLDELGYEAWQDVLEASQFGVPQRRPRFILIAAPRGSLPGIDPLSRLRASRRAFLAELGLGPGPTSCEAAIGDLEVGRNGTMPDPDWGDAGFQAIRYAPPDELTPYAALMRRGAEGTPRDLRLARHSPAVVTRMEAILRTCRPGRVVTAVDRERLGMRKRTTTPLDRAAPAPTISTLPDDLVHYAEPRTMTVREHARLQGFPDWFAFTGKYTAGGPERRTACPRYTQVANAVPPLLARAIGRVLIGLARDQKPPKLDEVA